MKTKRKKVDDIPWEIHEDGESGIEYALLPPHEAKKLWEDKKKLETAKEAAFIILAMDQEKVLDDSITPPCNIESLKRYDEAIEKLRQVLK